jgi:hypothetical protein
MAGRLDPLPLGEGKVVVGQPLEMDCIGTKEKTVKLPSFISSRANKKVRN